MREWVFASVPIAVVIYFLIYPDQLGALLDWAMGILR
jgi:hypothetical protein